MDASKRHCSRWTGLLIAVLAIVSVCSGAAAAEMTVAVLAADGSPVEHAAITLESDSDGSGDGQPDPWLVDQEGKQFRPWVSAVPLGAEVVFGNNDDITHHVYSFSQPARFSFRLQSGATHGPVKMEEPGVVVLGCNIHDWMVGYIHVGSGRHAGTTGPDGTVRFTSLEIADWRVSLWHPGLDEDELPAGREIRLAANDARKVEFRLSVPLDEAGPRRPLDDSGY